MKIMWILSKITFDTSAIDAKAWTIFITGFLVVVFAQWLIGVILKQFQNVISLQDKISLKKIAKSKDKTVDTVVKTDTKEQVKLADDDKNIAIAMAMHLYFNEQHDDESYMLTINTAERLNSPWAKKSFNILKK
ncbi:MAG: OadG family protein [Bacteroidales bacterium]|nr:OadG family protein [Bacteroidales bacterium]